MTSYLRRISPAMAVAILALVVALSSSATAALMISGKQIKDHSVTGKDLKKNAVKSKTIKNKSVKGKDLKRGAVKSVHVKHGSLTGADIKADSITSQHIADGTLTSSDISTTLLQTINSGASGFQVVTANSASDGPLLNRSVSASCQAGKVAISASAHSDGPLDVTPPEVVRTSPTTFTAADPIELSVVGLVGKIVLQVTCVSAG
jgi:hypothetical protein